MDRQRPATEAACGAGARHRRCHGALRQTHPSAERGGRGGAVIPRQGMKEKSGASFMDPKTQVTSVHGHPVLDLALLPLEASFALPLVHEIAGENDRAMLAIAVAAAEAAREAGNSPNTVMAAAAAIIGPKRIERALACAGALIDLFAHSCL